MYIYKCIFIFIIIVKTCSTNYSDDQNISLYAIQSMA